MGNEKTDLKLGLRPEVLKEIKERHKGKFIRLRKAEEMFECWQDETT